MDEISTKQKILSCAVELFSVKGFTETSIRELADAAGLNISTIYNHFPSKNAILEYFLNDFQKSNAGTFSRENASAKLKENPTVDGIAGCYVLTFTEDKADYFLKVLSVMLQEQHRNPLIKESVKAMILHSETATRVIFEILKEMNIIRQDADSDAWGKTISSLFYTFSNRIMLGIGDNSPDFSGNSMEKLIKHQIELILQNCGVNKRE